MDYLRFWNPSKTHKPDDAGPEKPTTSGQQEEISQDKEKEEVKTAETEGEQSVEPTLEERDHVELKHENDGSQGEKSQLEKPILNEDDEQFLERVTSGMQGPPSLSRRATAIADNGDMTEDAEVEEATTVPLPTSPMQEEDRQIGGDKPQTWKDRWIQLGAFVPTAPSGLPFTTPSMMSVYKKQQPSINISKDKDRQLAGATLQSAIDASRAETTLSNEKVDIEQNKRDMSSVLSNLNLSSINNRVVGISHETQNLLEAFNLVLKDIINGVPTAYDDLEKLLTEREGQLDKLFGTLPPFLQTLVKSVPVKMYSAMVPQLAAAVSTTGSSKSDEDSSGNVNGAAAPSSSNVKEESTSDGETTGKAKKSSYFPSVKSLVSEQGAVAAMLRSILSFLEMRFPAFLSGTNMLMSVAVFVLLFVFWYCYKRGRETRLATDKDEDVEKAAIEDESVAPVEAKEDLSLTQLEKSTNLEASAIVGAQDTPEVPLPDDSTESKATEEVREEEEKAGEKENVVVKKNELSEADRKINDLLEKSTLESSGGQVTAT